DDQKRAYLCVREQPQVRGQDTRDRARCSDARDRRTRVDNNVGDASNHATHQVKHQKTDMAELVLDVVAKDEQVEHVRGDVQQAAMQGHAGEQGGDRRAEWRWWANQGARSSELDRHYARREKEVVE